MVIGIASRRSGRQKTCNMHLGDVPSFRCRAPIPVTHLFPHLQALPLYGMFSVQSALFLGPVDLPCRLGVAIATGSDATMEAGLARVVGHLLIGRQQTTALRCSASLPFLLPQVHFVHLSMSAHVCKFSLVDIMPATSLLTSHERLQCTWVFRLGFTLGRRRRLLARHPHPTGSHGHTWTMAIETHHHDATLTYSDHSQSTIDLKSSQGSGSDARGPVQFRIGSFTSIHDGGKPAMPSHASSV